MEATEILKKIVQKGGLIGSCGKLYISDETLASQYIIECSEQLEAESVRKLWGKQLVNQVVFFRKNSKSLFSRIPK